MDLCRSSEKGVLPLGSATHRVMGSQGEGPAQHPLLPGTLPTGLKEQGQGNPASRSYFCTLCPSSCLQPTGLVESGDSQLLPSSWCRPGV